MRRIIGFLFLAVLSFPGWGALLYEQTFEGSTPLASRSGVDLVRTCGMTTATHGYNSVELSTRQARAGTQAIRFETQGNVQCPGHTEAKARNEIIWGAGLPGLQYHPSTDTAINTEWWFGFSVYFAADEGTVGWYDYNQDYYIAQPFSLDTLGSGSPEVNFVKQPGNDGYTYVQYRVSGGSEQPSSKPGFVPVKNGWNDFVLHYKRDPTNTGYMKIWLNGTVVHDRLTAPSAIYNHNSLRFKAGFYYAALNSPHRYVLYYDSIRIGDETSSFAEVDPAQSETPVCPGPHPSCNPTTGNSIDTVNGGTAVPSSTLIPFTATTDESIIGCQIGTLPESFVNWDYTGNASGKFNTGDLSSLTSATQTLKCFHQPHTPPITTAYTSWTATNSTDAAFSGDRYGYTTGLTVTQSGTSEYAETRIAIPDIVTNVAGDKMQFDFTYSCLAGNCDNLYFTVEDESTASPYHRNAAQGTAGALTTSTLNGGFGTGFSVVNRTLGDNVYRAILKYTATATAAKYKLRVGMRNGVDGQVMSLHEVIPRKNPTTTTIEKQITIAGTDVTAPTVTCTTPMSVVPDPEFDTYTATVNCTTTEIGGDYFVMLKDTNAAPADSDVVIAGTGAIRSATGTVDSMSISAEFTGLSYQDLWAYAVHQDAATNKATQPTSATFDDGVGIGQKKKFKWSIAGGNKIECFDSNLNLLVPFTGNMTVSITTGDYFSLGNTVNELVYAPVVAFTSGEAEFDDSDASVFGSVNSLVTGAQGYNFWATDGTCRADDAIQLIVE